MRADAPPREQIEHVLQAGVHAPNHHDTQPWRFFVLTNDARAEFGDALAEALRRAGRDRALEAGRLSWAERAKPMRSPVLIVVGVHRERDDPMTRREDLQAASAALQNMLLAADRWASRPSGAPATAPRRVREGPLRPATRTTKSPACSTSATRTIRYGPPQRSASSSRRRSGAARSSRSAEPSLQSSVDSTDPAAFFSRITDSETHLTAPRLPRIYSIQQLVKHCAGGGVAENNEASTPA